MSEDDVYRQQSWSQPLTLPSQIAVRTPTRISTTVHSNNNRIRCVSVFGRNISRIVANAETLAGFGDPLSRPIRPRYEYSEENVSTEIESISTMVEDESRNIDRSLICVVESHSDTDSVLNCSVCLEDLKHNDEYIKLHCGHTFHYNCINRWYKRSEKCPMCRTHILFECKERE